MRLESLVVNLGKSGAEGSSRAAGTPYQNIPSLPNVKAHRSNCEVRASAIYEMVDLDGKTVLDLACNVGTISGLLAQRGAKVRGVDHDEDSINLAREVNKGVDATFDVETIDLEFIESLPHYDVIVWLSQFNWLVKQKGLEHALDCLWEIGKHCDTLIFETAGRNDGSAPIDFFQEEILRLLCRNTIFTDIRDLGQWNDLWTPRNVFLCRKPLVEHKGFFSRVWPGIRGEVIKKFEGHEYGIQLKERGALFLRALEKTHIAPRLIVEQAELLVMSWAGPQATFLPEKDVLQIMGGLNSLGITHRDITPDNLRFDGEKIVLIDYSFAVFPGEVTNVSKDLGGKYKCPHGFNDEYSMRKIQQELLHL